MDKCEICGESLGIHLRAYNRCKACRYTSNDVASAEKVDLQVKKTTVENVLFQCKQSTVVWIDNFKKRLTSFFKRLFRLVAIVLSVVLLFLSIDLFFPEKFSKQVPLVKSITSSTCLYRGLAYYKAIGSYPRLSTGELAVDAVEERCLRSHLAFGSD